jgi:hypothetical protein
MSWGYTVGYNQQECCLLVKNAGVKEINGVYYKIDPDQLLFYSIGPRELYIKSDHRYFIYVDMNEHSFTYENYIITQISTWYHGLDWGEPSTYGNIYFNKTLIGQWDDNFNYMGSTPSNCDTQPPTVIEVNNVVDYNFHGDFAFKAFGPDKWGDIRGNYKNPIVYDLKNEESPEHYPENPEIFESLIDFCENRLDISYINLYILYFHENNKYVYLPCGFDGIFLKYNESDNTFDFIASSGPDEQYEYNELYLWSPETEDSTIQRRKLLACRKHKTTSI